MTLSERTEKERQIMKGIISSDPAILEAFLQRERFYAQLGCQQTFIFSAGGHDIATALFAPRRKGSVAIDVLYEMLAASLTEEDFVLRASTALVESDLSPRKGTGDLRRAGARLALQALLSAALPLWEEGHRQGGNGQPRLSLSGLVLAMVDDLVTARNRAVWIAPTWWNHLSKDGSERLTKLLVENGIDEAGSLLAHIEASLKALGETASIGPVPLLERGLVLSVPVASLSAGSLHLFCSLATMKQALAVADNLTDWDSSRREALRHSPAMENLFWTASTAPERDFLRGELGFGRTRDWATLKAFSRKVTETTEVPDGQINLAEFKDPSELPSGKTIWHFDRWCYMEAPDEPAPERIWTEPAESGLTDRINRFEDAMAKAGEIQLSQQG